MIVGLDGRDVERELERQRRRTGPRSSLSAWVGVKPPPKSVVTSMNIVAAVSVSSSMPMA